LTLIEADRFKQDLKKLKDGHYNITIKKQERTRSGQQNRYYFGVVLKTIADDTGDDIDSLHTYFKYNFLRERGKKFPKMRSTTELSTLEFSDYIEKISKFVAERLSIHIPPAESVDY
jgi:hypothetical protein